MAGLLIVNADDWGASENVTDATLACFQAHAITSVTAMVWMRDSDRAAALAHEHEIPVGLHLNLSLPFDGPAVPPAVRERQARLTDAFGRESWREGGPVPAPEGLLREAISDQLERFHELFGPPTHLDGHHHVHVHPGVLDLLPDGLAIRPLLRTPSHAKDSPSRRERGLRRRFTTPRWTFAFEHVHPALAGDGLETLAWARNDELEIMTHPAQGQSDLLLSDEWRVAVARYRAGSYLDLGSG